MGGRHRRAALTRLAAAVGLVLASALALTLGGAGAGVSATASAFDGSYLRADAFAVQGHSLLSVSLRLGGGDGPPPVVSSVDISVPAGYQLDLSAKPGTMIGTFAAGVASAADGSGSAFIDGDVVVDDPAVYAADPVAQACAPGVHAAVWRASLSIVGHLLPVTIAVDPASGATAYKLRFCPQAAPSATFPGGISFLLASIYVEDLVTPPTAAGDYAWSALVTPAAGFAPNSAAAFELRSHVVMPTTLDLTARYDAKQRSAIVTGHYLAGGAAKVGADVQLGSLSANGDVKSLGTFITDANGGFTLAQPVTRTTRFVALTDPSPAACSAPSTAPAGCISETASTPAPATALVVVPRKTDPRMAIRSRDQALAQRTTLSPTDFPSSWVAQKDFLGPCEAFAPDLRTLTITGRVFSPVFYSPDVSVAAFSTSTVYRSVADATAAFRTAATLKAAKCETTAIADSDSTTSVRPLSVPAVGAESRAFRGVISSSDGKADFDVVFIRVGRVVLEFEVYADGTAPTGLDTVLSRVLAQRARRG